jgi:ribosomal protein L11 methyltransferase
LLANFLLANFSYGDGNNPPVGSPPEAELTVRVTVPAADVDAVAGELWLAGATAIAEMAAGHEVELIAGFADAAAASDAASTVGGALAEVGPDDWLDAWKAYARVVRAGRLVVVPAWIDAPPTSADDILIEIDPGRMFGHGGHPTTRLLLEELERRIAGGETVLDVGCGSGILSVAAARLGARRVVAIDIDPDAVTVTKENAARNGVAVEVSTTPVAEIDGDFDLVLANIGADVLTQMAPDLERRGGLLLLSGLLADRVDDVAAAYTGTATASVLEGWAALSITA